jgi:hypothetical protein
VRQSQCAKLDIPFGSPTGGFGDDQPADATGCTDNQDLLGTFVHCGIVKSV